MEWKEPVKQPENKRSKIRGEDYNFTAAEAIMGLFACGLDSK